MIVTYMRFINSNSGAMEKAKGKDISLRMYCLNAMDEKKDRNKRREEKENLLLNVNVRHLLLGVYDPVFVCVCGPHPTFHRAGCFCALSFLFSFLCLSFLCFYFRLPATAPGRSFVKFYDGRQRTLGLFPLPDFNRWSF